MDPEVTYCVRRFQAARSILRARRPINEVLLFAEAFEECALGLKMLEGVSLGDVRADRAVAQIRQAVDTGAVVVWDARGPRYSKAEQMSQVERAAFEAALERLLQFISSKAGRRYLELVSREQDGAGSR